jgi:hypothetical protein
LKKLDRYGPPLALGLLLACAPAPLLGQEPSPSPSDGPAADVDVGRPTPEELGLRPGRPRVTPTRTDVPPCVDGVLDDAVWRTAARISEFTQQSPLDGAPVTEETDVYVAYDSDRIYFGFHAHYGDPSMMRANRVERDRAMADDLLTVYFDTFLDQQRGYDFDVNAYGVQGDGIMAQGSSGRSGPAPPSNAAIPPADRSWNALFSTGARIVEDGFTAEMAIPFKSLRYPTPRPGEPHRWGFQIVRQVKGKDQENQVWAPMSRDESSFFAQMGILEGMTDLSTSRNLEVLPTVTAIQHGEIDPTRPAFVDHSVDPDAGLNLKYGLTSNLTADFTINPDFSQIESDRPQIEVNQRYPLFFAELRPFFVEGAEIFNISAPVTFVHTRTIVDPDYGAKLTGQIGRVSLGVLTANDRAPGKVDDPEDPAFERSAQTYIGRALVSLGGEASAGVIATDREFLDGYSRLVGVNGNARFSPTFSGTAMAIGSWMKDAGAQPQTRGDMLFGALNQRGRHLSWLLYGFQISPDFGTDVGFVRRTDQRQVAGNVSYRFWPERWLINWGPQLNYSRNYDFDGVLQDEGMGVQLNFTFARNVSLNAGVFRDLERFGGIDFRKKGVSAGGQVNSWRRYSIGGDVAWSEEIYYLGPFLGRQISWSLNGQLRPTDALQTRIDFESRRFTDPARGGAEIFDVKILRAHTTYQFTSRLGMRNITEWNTQGRTFDVNVLFNYRVNAGTVFYLGYDDHYQQADLIEGDMNGDGAEEQLYFTNGLRRTNRAIFAKFQYLLRY